MVSDPRQGPHLERHRGRSSSVPTHTRTTGGAAGGSTTWAMSSSFPPFCCQPAINWSMAPWMSSSAEAGTEAGSCPKAERREMPYTVAQATAARRRTSASGVPSGWQAAIVSWSRSQYPIAACCSRGWSLLASGGPVREVVDVRLLADEGQIGIGESVQSGRRVIVGRRYHRAGPYRRLRHSRAGHGRQETSSAAEMDVRRLVADPQLLGDLTQAELLGRRVGEALEGGPQEPRFQPLLVIEWRFCHPAPSAC